MPQQALGFRRLLPFAWGPYSARLREARRQVLTIGEVPPNCAYRIATSVLPDRVARRVGPISRGIDTLAAHLRSWHRPKRVLLRPQPAESRPPGASSWRCRTAAVVISPTRQARARSCVVSQNDSASVWTSRAASGPLRISTGRTSPRGRRLSVLKTSHPSHGPGGRSLTSEDR